MYAASIHIGSVDFRIRLPSTEESSPILLVLLSNPSSILSDMTVSRYCNLAFDFETISRTRGLPRPQLLMIIC